MKFVKLAFLFVVCFATQGIAQNAPAEATATLNDVIAGLKQSEAAIRTLSVTLSSKSKRDNSGLPFQVAELSSRAAMAERWHVDSTGRGWNKAKGDSTGTMRDGKIRNTRFEHHGEFDGTSGRVKTIESDDRGNTHQRGSLQPALIRRGVSPFDFTTQHNGHPISTYLVDGKGQITGQQEWDGRRVTVVNVQRTRDGWGYKTEFWIDTERNYLVVRRRELVRKPGKDNWYLSWSIDTKGHEQVADGVWLPKIAWKRNFDAPQDEGEAGRVNNSYNAICSNWKINVEIPEDQLTYSFPPGLKVHGMLEAFREKQKKLTNFFVEPIETALQQKLIGRPGVVAYASVDATAFVDVNTHQITPEAFDFDGLKTRLQEMRAKTKQGSLYLFFDHGALGTDNVLGLFIREPVTAMCKRAGFKQVLASNTYHNDGKTWRPLDVFSRDDVDESNLGDARISVFAVGTSLSRTLTKGADIVIEMNERLDVESKQLLDQKAKQTIESALTGWELNGETASLKFTIGDPNAPVEGDDKLLHTQDDSEMQLDVVDFMRSLGAGEIRLQVKHGYTNFTSRFPVKEED